MENKASLVGDRGVQLSTMTDAWKFAQTVAGSGLAPKSMRTPEQVLIAMQTGMEVGLTPMRAINSVVVINGTPSWTGDAAVALIQQSAVSTSSFITEYTGSGDGYTCTVSTERSGQPVSSSFSVEDAKKAKLWGKAGPWVQYPKRMLYYRALGFLARDQFSDVLFGLRIEQEARDIPTEQSVDTSKQGEDPLLVTAIAASVPEPTDSEGTQLEPEAIDGDEYEDGITEIDAECVNPDLYYGEPSQGAESAIETF